MFVRDKACCVVSVALQMLDCARGGGELGCEDMGVLRLGTRSEERSEPAWTRAALASVPHDGGAGLEPHGDGSLRPPRV